MKDILAFIVITTTCLIMMFVAGFITATTSFHAATQRMEKQQSIEIPKDKMLVITESEYLLETVKDN